MDKLHFNDYQHLDHLKIAEKQIPRGKNVELHYHDHAFSEIALITQADEKVLHWVNSRSSHLSRGDVIVIHPNTVHAYEHTQELAMENLLYNANQLPIPQMDGGNLNLFDTFLNPDSTRCFSPELPVVHLPEKQMKDVEFLILNLRKELRKNFAGKHLCAFGLFLAILVKICRVGGELKSNIMPSSIMNAIHFLNIHFCEKIAIEQLAKLCFLSRRSFYYQFKKLTGIPPVKYQLEKRLVHAAMLIQTTDRSLGEIAYSCGFYDSNHMNRFFTRKFQKSPALFRLDKRLENKNQGS